MRCPRRDEFPPTARLSKGLDRYRKGGGLVGQPRGCSFCGSLPPDDFMEAVKAGCEVGPTDKNYKAYITLPGGEAKFYFQHLPEAQRHEFINLLNEHRVAFGYPGRFYVLPFFVTVQPAADVAGGAR
jgi:hypothetical protein